MQEMFNPNSINLFPIIHVEYSERSFVYDCKSFLIFIGAFEYPLNFVANTLGQSILSPVQNYFEPI